MDKTPNQNEFKQTALIFGGSGGIGSAIALEFISRQVKVAVADKNPVSHSVLIQEQGNAVRYFPTDVTREDRVRECCQRVAAEFGTIDFLVSLAGGALADEFRGLEGGDLHTMSQSIDLNLKSHMVILKMTLSLFNAALKADKSVVLVSSINAVRGYGLPAYSAAKAGLIGLVNATAVELGAKGIRINAVLPGTVMTPRTAKQPKDFDAMRRGTALNRLASPEEIAKVVVTLSIDMTCVTGQSVIADCGQVVKAP